MEPKIAVVGPGAMGCLFAGRLAAAGRKVWLVDRRPDRAGLINEQGIIILRAGTRETVRVPVVSDPAGLGPVGLVVVCVKAYDTRSAAEFARPLMGPDTDALSLQNGLGNVEALVEVFGSERVLAGTTAQGANLVAPGSVRHAGEGETVIGQPDGGTERARAAAELFTGAGIAASVTADLPALIWSKLVINAAINPLTALLGVKNGVLVELEPVREIMARAVAEIADLCAHRGIRLLHPDPYQKALDVARATADNVSSMLADVTNHRPTEVAQINGAAARSAREFGRSAPVNETLTRLVLAREALYGVHPPPA